MPATVAWNIARRSLGTLRRPRGSPLLFSWRVPHTTHHQERRMPIVRTTATPRFGTAAIMAATIAATVAMPAGLAAQLGAGVARTARLEVSTSSEAARTQFWSALDDFTSTYNFRASERMRAVVALD